MYFYEFSKFLKKPILQNTCKYLVLDFEQFSLLYVSLQCIQQDFNIGELSPKVIIRFQNPTFYYIFSRETRLRIEIENFDSFTSKYMYGYSWLFIVSSIFSYNRKISLLFFFLFPWKCFESTCFFETMQSHSGFISSRRLFLTFGNLTVIKYINLWESN